MCVHGGTWGRLRVWSKQSANAKHRGIFRNNVVTLTSCQALWHCSHRAFRNNSRITSGSTHNFHSLSLWRSFALFFSLGCTRCTNSAWCSCLMEPELKRVFLLRYKGPQGKKALVCFRRWILNDVIRDELCHLLLSCSGYWTTLFLRWVYKVFLLWKGLHNGNKANLTHRPSAHFRVVSVNKVCTEPATLQLKRCTLEQLLTLL